MASLLTVFLDNQGSDSRRGMSIVLINVIGQTGPFLGNNVFSATSAPRYIKGMSVCAAFMFFSAILALCQRWLLTWENAKLEQRYGAAAQGESNGISMEDQTPGAETKDAAMENYGPNFRYVL